MSKNYYFSILILIILILGITFFYDSSHENKNSTIQIASINALTNENTLFQVSTFSALSNGSYNGIITFGELRKHGNFGIGTSTGLDGEMIELNNTFYQVKSNGSVYILNDSIKTPFALVTFFEANETIVLNTSLNNTQLEQYLNNSLQSKNRFYAIKIQGTFRHIKARSVPKQNEPYPVLAEVIKNQTVFDFSNINGTIVGFWSPSFVSKIDPAGFHFHFISADGKSGGHVLGYELQNVTVGIDQISKLQLVLPQNGAFTILS